MGIMRETGVRRVLWAVVPVLWMAACGGDQPAAMGTEGAHEHGVARLNVVVEGTTATIEFISPAMGVYGFEYEPSTDDDRRRQAEGLETLRTRFAEMLVFDPGLGCTVEPIHVGMEGEAHDHAASDAHADDEEHVHDPAHHEGEEYAGHEAEHAHEEEGEHAHEEEGEHAHEGEQAHDGHAEVHGEFRVTCLQPLAGTRLTLNFGEVLPAVEQLDVQVIGDRPVGGRYRATGTGVQL
jgi:hypothetical protein